MVVKLYYSEISGSKEVKKRQQRIMMILDSKSIPYEAIDITEPGKESSKDFMLTNAKPRGDTKVILSPQIFSDDLYCGDYDDFDLANENDVLEKFLNSPKIEKNVAAPVSTTNNVTNGSAGSREPSVEASAVPTNGTNDNENNEAEQQQEPTSEAPASSEPTVDSTTSEQPQEETGIDQEEEQVDE